MSTTNEIRLVGRLGQSMKLKETTTGNFVGNLFLATEETYRAQNGEKKTITEWHNCVIFGKYAKSIEPLAAKGNLVMVIGKLTYRVYNNDAGQEIKVSEIVVNDFMLLSSVIKKEQ